MATKVFMEALSPTMEEGRIASWLKKEGDQVHAGDVIAEVETDKAIMELQARGDGVLKKILVADGETADVGALVAVIGAEDEDVSDLADDGKKPAPEQKPAGKKDQKATREKKEDRDDTKEKRPEARKEKERGGRVKASPLARRIASDKGIDLARIEGSGPGGRVVMRDVESARAGVSAGDDREGWEDVSLSQVRKTIARRLVQSIGPVPHFFLTTEIDMERAAEAREALNAAGDVRISFNDIVIKIAAMALRQHRECNAWWQEDHIRYFNEVHIGMAVAIKDGLITPVIRNAHRKGLREIAHEARELANRARELKLKQDEYTGATFSVSNLGMFGIDEFTAVINPPEAGILAVGALAEKPVVTNGEVTVRRRMRVTMSCDHRVIDGATGAKFLQTVRMMLENPLAIVW